MGNTRCYKTEVFYIYIEIYPFIQEI